jgi:hypothetical protein
VDPDADEFIPVINEHTPADGRYEFVMFEDDEDDDGE